MALTAISEVSTEEMCRELYQDVKKLMQSNSSYIKKKAIIAATRIIKNIPDTIEDFMEVIDKLIHEHSHSIQLATLTLMYEIAITDKSTVKELRKYTSNLKKTLKNLLHSGYAPEYDISGIKDPFLQAKILQVMCVLGIDSEEVSDEINDILAEIATNTEGTRNTAHAILYECVRTIMSIQSSQQGSSSLRVLGINILGKFLVNKENNIRFVALKSL